MGRGESQTELAIRMVGFVMIELVGSGIVAQHDVGVLVEVLQFPAVGGKWPGIGEAQPLHLTDFLDIILGHGFENIHRVTTSVRGTQGVGGIQPPSRSLVCRRLRLKGHPDFDQAWISSRVCNGHRWLRYTAKALAGVAEWQTRYTQNALPKGVGVRLSPPAPPSTVE